MRKYWAVILLSVLFVSIFAVSVYAALTASKTVMSTGRISIGINVGVYKNSACTQAATSIDWGNLTAGASSNVTLYIKNTGSARETISMSTNSWSPTNAGQYITITWNRNNTVLTANQIVVATFTITVSSAIDSSITSFNNNIVITGTT